MRLLHCTVGALALAAGSAFAQSWLGQPLVVENRGGAGGTAVVKAAGVKPE
ncbi:MAG TPA: hypothetical protein VN675_03670 [Burkholderiales bacterium]|nr:hypothetical protein [Burkholderiales bacterium]